MHFAPSFEIAVGRAEYRAITGVAQLLSGARSAHAVIGGVHVPYFIRQTPAILGGPSGDPVVLVHGFGGDKEGWLMMAGMLGRRRPLVIPDLPGFGAAGAIPKRSASAKAQAQVVASLLDHLDIRRAHLVGNSMGGGISLRFAADNPARTASITLLGSVGPIVEKSELGLALDRGENPLLVDSPEDLERLVRFVAEKSPPLPRAARAYLGSDRFARREAQAELFEGWVTPPDSEGVPEDLESIKAPALVIQGGKDRCIHPSTGRALAKRLPNARLELLEHIGHVPMIEAPKLTAQLVERFLRTVG
jgi:abhydrolase domain-containing protein 6